MTTVNEYEELICSLETCIYLFKKCNNPYDDYVYHDENIHGEANESISAYIRWLSDGVFREMT
jgi:hypothetical protein